MPLGAYPSAREIQKEYWRTVSKPHRSIMENYKAGRHCACTGCANLEARPERLLWFEKKGWSPQFRWGREHWGPQRVPVPFWPDPAWDTRTLMEALRTRGLLLCRTCYEECAVEADGTGTWEELARDPWVIRGKEIAPCSVKT